MPAPANDSFANAQYIFDGVTISANLVSATIETGESWTGVTTGLASVWYKWVANYSATVTISLPTHSSQYLNVFYSPGTSVTDTLSQLVPVTSDVVTASVAVTEGTVYYFRVAVNASDASTFKLAYPIGRASGVLRAIGTNDLPTRLVANLPSSAGARLLEAVGFGPSSELVTSRIDLLAIDEHSTSVFARNLIRNSNNSPSVSCERWLRVRFEPPFTAITNMRLWVNNYSPGNGWAINFGTTTVYREPSTSLSDIAYAPIPSSDPGISNLGFDLLTGGQVQHTPWIVLQAVYTGNTPGRIQVSDLNFEFDWTEM